MSVEIIDTLKQKNNGSFPIAMASDVQLSDGTDLETKISNLVISGGADGEDGKSAYEVAVENGFTGTETEWLATLQGNSPTVTVSKANKVTTLSITDTTGTTTAEIDESAIESNVTNTIKAGITVEEEDDGSELEQAVTKTDVLSCIENSETVKDVTTQIYKTETVTEENAVEFEYTVGILYKDGNSKVKIDSTKTSTNTTSIDVVEGEKYKFHCMMGKDRYTCGYLFADSSGVALNDGFDSTLSGNVEKDIEIEVPTNAIKLYVCVYSVKNNADIKKIIEVEQKTSRVETLEKEVFSKRLPCVLMNFDAPSLAYSDGRHELCMKYNIPYTINVQINDSGDIVYPDKQIGKNNVIDMIKDGVDFAIYSSYLKPDEDATIYNTVNDENIALFETYVKYAKEKAESIGVFNPTAWFSRFMRTGSAMNKALINNGFKVCRGYKYGTEETNLQFINPSEFSPYDEENFNIVTYAIYPSTTAKMIELIDSAIEQGLDIAPFSHNIYADETSAESGYGITADLLETVLQHIALRVKEGKCQAVTFREWYKIQNREDGEKNDMQRMAKYNDFRITQLLTASQS